MIGYDVAMVTQYGVSACLTYGAVESACKPIYIQLISYFTATGERPHSVATKLLAVVEVLCTLIDI